MPYINLHYAQKYLPEKYSHVLLCLNANKTKLKNKDSTLKLRLNSLKLKSPNLQVKLNQDGFEFFIISAILVLIALFVWFLFFFKERRRDNDAPRHDETRH